MARKNTYPRYTFAIGRAVRKNEVGYRTFFVEIWGICIYR